MSWWDGLTDLMDMSLNNLREMVMYWEAWGAAVGGVADSLSQVCSKGQQNPGHGPSQPVAENKDAVDPSR